MNPVPLQSSPKKLIDFLQLSAEYLQQKGIESARLEAELLLADLLGCKRIDLYLDFNRPLTKLERENLRDRIARRGRQIPLQYITGKTDFFGRNFLCREGVFIPRPETERLIEIAKEAGKNKRFKRVLEVGSGTGVIGLTLLHENIAEMVIAIDISEKAFKLSAENAEHTGLIPVYNDEAKVVFESADDSISKFQYELQHTGLDHFVRTYNSEKFDLIISNPPYIATSEAHSLPETVRKFEPDEALFSGADGLDFYRSLRSVLQNLLYTPGVFLGEIGEKQGDSVQSIFRSLGNTTIHQDYNDRDRILMLDLL
ncbi:peptide chain release factor N(5)-glutamine methyltransferase [bacterium]|nr:peptide chain release factor N(5)-glutamine methyltransferase [bacterium]